MQEPLFEEFITDDGFSPTATLGEIKVKGMQFSTMICIKTLYNMIDRGGLLSHNEQRFAGKTQ